MRKRKYAAKSTNRLKIEPTNKPIPPAVTDSCCAVDPMHIKKDAFPALTAISLEFARLVAAV